MCTLIKINNCCFFVFLFFLLFVRVTEMKEGRSAVSDIFCYSCNGWRMFLYPDSY